MKHPRILARGVFPAHNQRAPAGDAAASARLARLCRGTAQLETLTQQMGVEARGDTGGELVVGRWKILGIGEAEAPEGTFLLDGFGRCVAFSIL